MPRIGLAFESAVAKLKRADEHRRSLAALLQGFASSEEWAVWADPQPQVRGEYVEYLISVRLSDFDLLFNWNAVLGDVIHCLRSALDYLAWESTERTQLRRRKPIKPPLPPFPKKSPWKEIFFPVVKNSVDWPSAVNGKLWGVSPRLVTVFKRAQPFYAGKDGLGGAHISALHELDLIDKHRSVDLLASEVRFQAIKVPTKGLFIPLETWKLEPMAPIGRLRFNRGDAPKPQDMQMQFHFSFQVAFGKGTPVEGELVLPTLGRFHKTVSGVVQAMRSRASSLWWHSDKYWKTRPKRAER